MTLFELGTPDMKPSVPAQQHSDTSVRAAAAMLAQVGNLRWQVLHFLRSRGAEGATDNEMMEVLSEFTGHPGATFRPRRIELTAQGLVKDSGKKRKTRSGRQAVVWVAVEGK